MRRHARAKSANAVSRPPQCRWPMAALHQPHQVVRVVLDGGGEHGHAPVVVPRALHERDAAMGHHRHVAGRVLDAAAGEVGASLPVVRPERRPAHGAAVLDRPGGEREHPRRCRARAPAPR